MSSDLKIAVERARNALASPGEVVGRGNGRPRFELFHAANSICSQKVRSVLAWHRLPYVSHPVNLFRGETYLPDYVRLRMMGCERLGGPLASHHSGDTSASAGGCDGAVVPTLIDWDEDAVLVDSRLICLHLDAQAEVEPGLRPPDLAARIDQQLRIIDGLPNYQLLMGRKQAGAENSDTRGSTGAGFSARKVAWCDQRLAECATDKVLVRAYTAKRAKELSAADHLFSPEAMADAYARAESALGQLEQTLRPGAGAWLFGAAFTMADVFWAAELLRLQNIGVIGDRTDNLLPEVDRYSAALASVPAIRSSIIDWIGASF